MAEESTQITGTRRIIVLSSVGAVIVLSLIGAFVPEAREYITGAAKMILGAIPSFIK